jgi:hypothetical protein
MRGGEVSRILVRRVALTAPFKGKDFYIRPIAFRDSGLVDQFPVFVVHRTCTIAFVFIGVMSNKWCYSQKYQ